MFINLSSKRTLLFILLVNSIFAKANLFLPINIHIQADQVNGLESKAVLKKATQKLGLDGVIVNYNSNYKSKLIIFLTNFEEDTMDDETFFFLVVPHPFKECNNNRVYSYIPGNLEYSSIFIYNICII